MSWDVYLTIPGLGGRWEGPSWNYTHNVNGMIAEAMRRADIPFELHPGSRAHQWRLERIERDATCYRRDPDTGESASVSCSMTCCEPSWWRVIDGRPGPDGLRIICAVLEQWDLDPSHYRAMNPPNGWGDFDSIHRVFEEMAEAATVEVPIEWRASG